MNTKTELHNTLTTLKTNLTTCQQIAYHEIKLTEPPTIHTKPTNHAHPPLPIDSAAWDLLDTTEDILQEIWAELGHRKSHTWPKLIDGMLNDLDYMSTRQRTTTWITTLQTANQRLQKITDRHDIQPNTIILTPSQISRYAQTHFNITISRKTIYTWLNRGTLENTPLTHGYYAIQHEKYAQTLHQHGYQPTTK